MARQPVAGTAGSQARGARGGGLRFFGEVFSELRKVTWPTRPEATRLTILVLIVSAFMGLVLGGIDYLFAELTAFLVGA